MATRQSRFCPAADTELPKSTRRFVKRRSAAASAARLWPRKIQVTRCACARTITAPKAAPLATPSHRAAGSRFAKNVATSFVRNVQAGGSSYVGTIAATMAMKFWRTRESHVGIPGRFIRMKSALSVPWTPGGWPAFAGSAWNAEKQTWSADGAEAA